MASRVLMHVGPSVGNYNVLSASTVPNVGFASPEFNAALKFSLEQYAKLTGADDTYTPFILPGGGTSAMESSVSFLQKGSKILIVTNGLFGDRWEKILSRYPVEFKVLRAAPGNVVPTSQIASELQADRYDAVTLTHVETSTGARIPLKEVAAAIRPYVDLILVDGVSSIGGERINAAEWNLDICLSASQKALGAQTGAGLLVASQRAMEKLDGESISGYYLDLRNWLPIMKAVLAGKGGYFATPPIGTIFSLKQSFELINAETPEQRYERHRVCAEAFRKGIVGMGLEIVAHEGVMSNTVTGIYIENTDMGKFLAGCLDQGVEFASGVHPKIKDRYFRVGHMGWVEPSHIMKALSVIESTASSLGVRVNKGAAESAAKAVFDRSPFVLRHD